jgi:hypothetical protein
VAKRRKSTKKHPLFDGCTKFEAAVYGGYAYGISLKKLLLSIEEKRRR